MELIKSKSISIAIVNVVFLIILNLVLAFVIGYLTLDSAANLNSRIGAALLSFFIPYFIVAKTKEMSGLERMLKFGTGFIIYIIAALIMVGFPVAFGVWLLPCLVVALGILFYGEKLI
ncbi:MAG: hypothetical protein K9J37_04515 [Saprospiraceae bacterium]|nr:hypothetical protein [Saprospiraceae bacterium]MCF8249149.1 hypothetical protein [Saprospiraceae bacterium]MCF8278909.1 hypothetical protein [Bacteroidales bacterium]MCF8311278.1 hypothetical protein [Saprospiraceae bacterium]MCF8440158.1 hypothetical protein [Saprospiraceae bacterium]